MAKGLGKGLDALLSEMGADKGESVREIDLKDIRPNPYQPRKIFDKKSIEELKDSIIEHGVLQPIIVRQSIKGYEIVVGERRYRAAKEAKLKKIPAIVKELSEQQMMEFSVLENLQREDLTPIEEASAYQLLMERLSLTQEELAKRLGKSRSHIANHIRLLSLPADIQKLISDGKISMGHGRALLGLRKKEKLPLLVEKVIKEDWNVRQLEKTIQQLNENVSRETKRKKQTLSPFLKMKQEQLQLRLGTSVTIKPGKKKGKIEIDYFSEDDLERIVQLLNDENE